MRNFLTIRIAVSVSLLFTAAARADHDESVTKKQTIEFIVGQVQENCIDRSFEDWKQHDWSGRTQILEFNISGDKAMFRYAFRRGASDDDTVETPYSMSINLDELYGGDSIMVSYRDDYNSNNYHSRYYRFISFHCKDAYANCINKTDEKEQETSYITEYRFYGCPVATDKALARAFRHLISIYDQSREESLF